MSRTRCSAPRTPFLHVPCMNMYIYKLFMLSKSLYTCHDETLPTPGHFKDITTPSRHPRRRRQHDSRFLFSKHLGWEKLRHILPRLTSRAYFYKLMIHTPAQRENSNNNNKTHKNTPYMEKICVFVCVYRGSDFLFKSTGVLLKFMYVRYSAMRYEAQAKIILRRPGKKHEGVTGARRTLFVGALRALHI